MKYNLLERLPKVLVRFARLETLELADNRIVELDDEVLGQLQRVRCASSAFFSNPADHYLLGVSVRRGMKGGGEGQWGPELAINRAVPLADNISRQLWHIWCAQRRVNAAYC